MYQEQFNKGEINEAQYKTLVSTSARNANFYTNIPAITQPFAPETTFFDES
jgi:hypothetical protein